MQVAVVMALLVGGFGMQFSVVNPLMATEIFHLGSFEFGLLGTLTAVGGIVGNFYSARRKDPGPAEFLVWSAFFGAVEMLAAVMPSGWAYGALMAPIGAAIQLFASSAVVYVQKTTPDAQRGYALSAYNAGFMGFVPAGSFAVAGLAAAPGPRWSLIVPGAVILCCAIAALAAMPRSRARSSAPAH